MMMIRNYLSVVKDLYNWNLYLDFKMKRSHSYFKKDLKIIVDLIDHYEKKKY